MTQTASITAPQFGRPSWAQQVAGLLVAYLRAAGGSAPRLDAERRLATYGASWDDTASAVFGGKCAGELVEVAAPHDVSRLVLIEDETTRARVSAARVAHHRARRATTAAR